MDRLKTQAAKNREAAKVLRRRGKDTAAKEMEARADELESGRVTDCTDAVTGLISWAFRR
ncbi:hypothetical protein QNO09_08875 [Streptomyces sp. 378]|uniref:hypothetical protein n=1 Tax=Streptomyces sp. 378 TaxID=3049412 RepID=UPI0024C457F3|nr:hypothetical protein [Streptomyces sp. 378]MDK1343410.1 hypothetical protein [Streptomyces sp. 378]